MSWISYYGQEVNHMSKRDVCGFIMDPRDNGWDIGCRHYC
jgi:hypothetical protein